MRAAVRSWSKKRRVTAFSTRAPSLWVLAPVTSVRERPSARSRARRVSTGFSPTAMRAAERGVRPRGGAGARRRARRGPRPRPGRRPRRVGQDDPVDGAVVRGVEEADLAAERAGRGDVGDALEGDLGGGDRQVDAGGELVDVRDEVAAQASVQLDQARPVGADAQLGVGDAVVDADGPVGVPDQLDDGLGPGLVLPAGDQVADLLEVRLGAEALAGDADGGDDAVHDGAVDAQFGSFDVLLDEDGVGGAGALEAAGGGEPVGLAQAVGVAGHHDAEAAAEGAGLDDDGEADGLGGGDGLVLTGGRGVADGRHPGGLQGLAGGVLVAADLGGGRVHGPQAEAGGHRGDGGERPLVPGDDRGLGDLAAQVGDGGNSLCASVVSAIRWVSTYFACQLGASGAIRVTSYRAAREASAYSRYWRMRLPTRMTRGRSVVMTDTVCVPFRCGAGWGRRCWWCGSARGPGRSRPGACR